MKRILSLLAALFVLATPTYATLTSTVTRTTSAAGNGTTTNFTISFPFQNNNQIRVLLEVINSGATSVIPQGTGAGSFSITGGNPGTTVVMGTAPTSLQRVIIERVTPVTQTVDYDPNSLFPADDHEGAMDKIVQSLQELTFSINNATGLSTYTTITTAANTLPNANTAGDILVNTGSNVIGFLPPIGGNSSILMIDSSSSYNLRWTQPAGLYTPSEVVATGGNAYGSTATKVMRFDQAIVNIGPDITYADSAANGASFTINTKGLYGITFCLSGSGGAVVAGASLNSTELTTDVESIIDGHILFVAQTSGANAPECPSVQVNLKPTDVIRPHGDAGTFAGAASKVRMRVVRIR